MTITSVVFGDGMAEGGWGEPWVCASTDPAGNIVIRMGKSSFMVYLDSVWLLVRRPLMAVASSSCVLLS
jgi:hypothetical protein